MFVAGRRRELGIGLLAAGMVLLSACSGSGSTPQTLPRLSTTPAAATSAAPPTSQAAELAAAAAVVRQYVQLKNHLSSDMNAQQFAHLESSTCPCRRFLSAIRALAAAHQHYFGRVTSLHLTPTADSNEVVEVLASYDTTAGGVARQDGQVLSKGHARRGVLAMFYVQRTRAGWQIFNILNLKPGTSA